jgi:hypothetical protein
VNSEKFRSSSKIIELRSRKSRSWGSEQGCLAPKGFIWKSGHSLRAGKGRGREEKGRREKGRGEECLR